MSLYFFVWIFMWNVCFGQYNSYDSENDFTGTKEIPLDILLRLDNITDMNQLFDTIVESDDYDTDLFNYNYPEISVGDYSDKGTRRKREVKVSKRRPAGCTPGPQVVKLKQLQDLHLAYFPSCIKLPQCGGCCSQELLTCTPVKVKRENIPIIQMYYTGGNKLRVHKKEIVTVEEHIKCKCGCLIQETDCNSMQEYSSETCRCLCVNKTESKACDSEVRVWNHNSCECECRNTTECSTGYKFSNTTCSCESNVGGSLRRLSGLRYRFKKKAGNRQKNIKKRRNFLKFVSISRNK